MRGGVATIEVRLRARGGANEIIGERDGRYLVCVAAAPVDGRANQALCRLLAKQADVPRSAVTIIGGERSRDKVVMIDGLDEADLRKRLLA